MHQTDHERNSDSSLNGALDRVQMTPSDRTRAEAEMLRAQFIANVVLKAINGLQDAIRLATRPIQGWLEKSKSPTG